LIAEQICVVQQIGFASILELACSGFPNDVFIWLAAHMNSTTGCIELTNGFSFTINQECIQIITGLPSGCLPISFSSNSAIVQRVNLEIHGKPSKPLVHELAEIIKKGMSGPPFAKAFVLLANCLLLSPTNKSFPSSMHYQAIDDYEKIKEFDWCSYVLHWLLISVNKFQLDSCIGTCSGCGLIPVVCIAVFNLFNFLYS
jgi:hypothetical protein